MRSYVLGYVEKPSHLDKKATKIYKKKNRIK